MRICYFDCFNGAAGDMLLAALLDAGAPHAEVRRAVGALRLESVSLVVGETSRRGLRAARVEVRAREELTNRSLSDIERLLDGSELDDRVRELSRATFRELAEAESRVHAVSIDEVHFHEVGALDAIVDVVGTCAAVAALGVERVAAGPVALGTGTTSTDHGSIPLPAPAVTELLAARGALVVDGGEGETLTPTGAALLSTLVDEFGGIPSMRLSAIGYGAGARDTEVPNVVRVLIGEATDTSRTALIVEANIDDTTPELVAYAAERLIESGASDVWTTPITMKKGRSAVTLSALIDSGQREQILDVLFEETSTLGVRTRPVEKEELDRAVVTVQVHGRPVRVKLGLRRGEVVNLAPEHDDARAAAEATGVPLKEIYALALERARAARSVP